MLTGKQSVGRHYLNDRPVHCGDLLEMQLDDGVWLTGRYEWAGNAGAIFVVQGEAIRLDNRLYRWHNEEQ